MTIKNFIDNAKFDFNIKANDNAQKNNSKNSGTGFLNIFETTNKSYNFSFEKTEKFSYKDLKQNNENKNFKLKEFKSEYEKFNHKLDSDNPIKKRAFSEAKEAVTEAKEAKKETVAEAKEAVTEAKEAKKETVAEAKEAVTEAKEDKKEVVSEAKEAVAEAKEDKKEVVSEAKETVAEAKEDKKEVVSEAKETVAEAKEDKKELISEAKETVAEAKDDKQEIVYSLNNLNIDIQNNLQKPLANLNNQEQSSEAASSNENKLLINSSENNSCSEEELNAIQKQIKNEKILNKQANILLEQSAKNLKETSENLSELNKTNQENINANKSENIDPPVKQAQKPEVLIDEDVLKKLNKIDKNTLKQLPEENLKPLNERLSSLINNQETKPVITNIEIEKSVSKTNFDDKNQKEIHHELKINISQNQPTLPNENTLQKIDLQKTFEFDKILNTKQNQAQENSVLNQLKDKLSSEISNKSQININLRPEHLGRVSINIVSQNGVLTANITAESHEVKNILNKGLETLKQTIAEQGINIGKMIVNVKEPDLSNQNHNPEQNYKHFEQQNSNTSNMNHQYNKQNNPKESSLAHSNNESYQFDEETEQQTNEQQEEKTLMHQGTVDYKI